MRIAHFGTFDVQNYGDLLFPLILERRLADIGEEFTHVSPVGGPPVWSDCVSSVSATQFLASQPRADGIVIGGGHIIRASRSPLTTYDEGGFSSYYAYPKLWLGAGYAAARDNLPLCWNAPGVTEEFPEVSSRLARWTASVSDYVSVRDEKSLRLLREMEPRQEIAVVPDTAMEVGRLWTEQEISDAYEEAFACRGKPVPRRTVAFHLTPRWITENTGIIASRLQRISERLDATPVLIAIGPCHGDSEMQRRVAEQMTNEPLVIDRPRSVMEVAACIAHSEAYIGSSMHGMVTACSFGLPAMLVVSGSRSKFTSFLEQFGLSYWRFDSWSCAEEHVDELMSAPSSVWTEPMQTAAPILDAHWEKLRASLLKTGDQSTGPTAAVDKRQALEELHEAGTHDFGCNEIFRGIIVDNLISRDARASTLEQQLASRNEQLQQKSKELQQKSEDLRQRSRELRQKSEESEQLTKWMQRLDGQSSALLHSRQWRLIHALSEASRKLLRKPHTPSAADNLEGILQQFRENSRPQSDEDGV